MNSFISRNELKYVKQDNQLCNCNCDLTVFREFNKETVLNVDEVSKKFAPYRFENKLISAYCKECDSCYTIRIKYEASSKTDYEVVESIWKHDYFWINDYINSIEKNYKDEASYSLFVDNYIIRVLENTVTDEETFRVISYENTLNEYNYISNKKICYNCDNRFLRPNKTIECLIHKDTFNIDYVCDRFCSIYQEEEE